MRHRAWQIAIFTFIILGLSNLVLQVPAHLDADFGMHYRLGAGRQLRVVQVDRGGPAARAGIAVGDVLAYPSTFGERVSLTMLRPGDMVTFQRTNKPPVTVVARLAPSVLPGPLVVTWITVVVLFLAVAAVVAARRPEDSAARALAVFLTMFGLGMGWDARFFGPEWQRFAAIIAQQTFFVIGGLAMLAFATRFPSRDTHGLRAWLARALVPLAIVLFASAVANLSAVYFAGNISVNGPIVLLYDVCYTALVFASIASFWASLASAKGAERARMRWLLLTFGMGFSGLLVSLILTVFRNFSPIVQYANFTLCLIPIGLAYVILRHRVLDVAFVINRAVVYGIVSLVIVGAFIGIEWLIGHFVEGRSENIVLQFAASLALGLSARFIHARVDRSVDDIFFRERHLAESAVRRFAVESLMITDRSDLLDKTVAVAVRCMRLSGAAIYVRHGSTYVKTRGSLAGPEQAGENDSAVLSMRTWFQPQDLSGGESALSGEVAFPMRVRAELTGFLVCGPKLSGEFIAPDERSALATLAHDVGLALDSLRIHEVEQELARLKTAAALPALEGATGGANAAF